MKRNTLVTLLIIGTIGGTLHARGFGGGGFGGFHGGGGFGGGGFHGGNFGGGGFGGGGFHGGDFGGGGTHSFGGGQFGGGGFHDNFGGGEFGGGGFRGGGNSSGLGSEFGGDGFRGAGGLAGDGIRGAGGLGGDGFRGAGGFDGMRGGSLPTAHSLNSFLGLPTDMGMHQAASMPHSFGYSGDAHGLSAHEWTGPDGTTVAHGSVGERGAAVGPNAAAVGERGARGTVIRGPDGTTIAHGAAGERGAVVGPNAAVGGARGVRGTAVRGPEGNVVAHGSAVTRNWSSADLRVQGNYARGNFNRYDCFNRGWYGHHPNAWWGGYAAGVWTGATWSALNGWFGADWPVYGYNYGNDITYVNNNVCLYGQPIATADDYYQSAADLVQTGVNAQVQSQPPPSSDAATAPNPKNADWLPLGVFEALQPGEKSSKMMIQLAVNKAGIIRGNYFNTGDDNTQLIEGSINKKTARAAWCVADKKDVVFDTGLYNLTQDESPVLVHFGKDKQEQWTLVRLKQKSDGTDQK